MKTTIILTTIAVTLAACATDTPARATGDGRTGFSVAQTTFTGWVRFTGDEFQLYADQDQVLQPVSRPCLSGAASRDLQRQASRDLNGQKVIVIGRTQAWTGGRSLEYQGSTIRNDCGGDFVLLADAIRPQA